MQIAWGSYLSWLSWFPTASQKQRTFQVQQWNIQDFKCCYTLVLYAAVLLDYYLISLLWKAVLLCDDSYLFLVLISVVRIRFSNKKCHVKTLFIMLPYTWVDYWRINVIPLITIEIALARYCTVWKRDGMMFGPDFVKGTFFRWVVSSLCLDWQFILRCVSRQRCKNARLCFCRSLMWY